MTYSLFGGGGGLLGNPYQNKEPRLEFYLDTNQKHRWRIYMSSDIVAASTQGYATKQLCIDNLKKIANHIIQLDKSGKLI